MNYRLPDNIGYIIQIMGTAWNIKMYYFKNKKKKRKGKKMYVAQQRIYLTKKEGIFLVFSQTNGCFHCFEFRGLTSWKT